MTISKSVRIIEDYHFSAFQERCMPNAFKENGRKIVESLLKDDQNGFRPGRSPTEQIFTLKQVFRNPGSRQKMFSHNWLI